MEECVLFFSQVTPSDALPASMFIPVPSPDRESQSTPHTANSHFEDSKKQVGQYLITQFVYIYRIFYIFNKLLMHFLK